VFKILFYLALECLFTANNDQLQQQANHVLEHWQGVGIENKKPNH
jgi:hypothetical protein